MRNTSDSAICINAFRAVTITGNIIYGGHADFSVVSRQTAVLGNFVENSSPGLYLNDLPKSGVVSVTITGNSLRDCGPAFVIHNVTQVNIANNTIAGTKGLPALNASATVDSFTIVNNQFLTGISHLKSTKVS